MNKKKNQEVYCICLTSDTDRFMICCDNCEIWYHGDCIGITRSFSKTVKTFYCFVCQEKNPKLVIKFKDSLKRKRDKAKDSDSNLSNDKNDKNDDEDSDFEYVPKKMKHFEDSDDDDFRPIVNFDKSKDNKKTNIGNKRGRKKAEEKKSVNTEEDKQKIKNWRGAGRKPKDYYLKENNKDATKTNKKREKKEKSKKDDKDNDKEDIPKQCYGPGCKNLSLKNSKYCCDDCGLALARKRIIEILPERIEQWKKIPSKSDEMNHKQLEKIRNEFIENKKSLSELDEKQKALEKIIALSKEIKPMTEEECKDQECELEGELSTYCVTCGHEVSYKNAMRHMERCFNKFESQTSFSSIFKTKTEGVFCDYYNSAQKSYCKRLKLLCPEHSKEIRVNEDEVCGAPLVTNCFEPTGEYCRLLKKKCTKHFCWEKLRRAEIDMERVNLWLKLDDLFEKEQKIRFSMANRGNVLSLMIHSIS